MNIKMKKNINLWISLDASRLNVQSKKYLGFAARQSTISDIKSLAIMKSKPNN
jgi:hypothetical protein